MMERELPISCRRGELNISLSTTHMGLGFILTINDFGYIWEVSLLLLHVFYFTRRGE